MSYKEYERIGLLVLLVGLLAFGTATVFAHDSPEPTTTEGVVPEYLDDFDGYQGGTGAADPSPTWLAEEYGLPDDCVLKAVKIDNPVTGDLKDQDNGKVEWGTAGETDFNVDLTIPSGVPPNEIYADDNSLDFDANMAVYFVWMKAGSHGNLYRYEDSTMLDTFLYTPQPDSISHVTFYYCLPEDEEHLTVSKTVNTSYTRTHNWDIDKSVGTEKMLLVPDGSGDEAATWNVDVTYEGYEDSNLRVFGEITITNTGQTDAVIKSVVDELCDNLVADVQWPDGFESGDTLEVDQSVTLTYNADANSMLDCNNLATVTTAIRKYTVEAAIPDWGDPDEESNKTVNIQDISDHPELGTQDFGPLTAEDRTFTYSQSFAWEDYGEAGSHTYENTATIVETEQSATATLKVNAEDDDPDPTGSITVTKTIDTEEGDPHEEVEFTLTGEDLSRTATTDSKGIALFEDLPLDVELILSEDLDGWTAEFVDGNTFTLQNESELLHKDVRVINSELIEFTGTITVIKTKNGENNEIIAMREGDTAYHAGVTFTLTNGTDEWSETTDSEGIALFEDLPLLENGKTYTLTEELDEGWTTDLYDGKDSNKVTLYPENSEHSFRVHNTWDPDPTGSITVTKTIDTEEGDPHEEVEFTLTGEDLSRTATTDSEGIAVFEDLPLDVELTLSEDLDGWTADFVDGNTFTLVEEQLDIHVHVINTEDDPPTPRTRYYNLTLNVSPEGSGVASAAPDRDRYRRGTEVDISAEANEGYEFSHWIVQRDEIEDADTTVVMNGNRTATAYFEAIVEPEEPEAEPKLEISLTKTADVDSVEPGEIINYTLVVENTGEADLTGIQLADTLFGSAWTQSIEVLESGESVSFEEAYEVPDDFAESKIVNAARVTAREDVSDEARAEVVVETPKIVEIDVDEPEALPHTGGNALLHVLFGSGLLTAGWTLIRKRSK